MLGPPSAADSESAARPRRGRRGPDSRRGRCWPRVDRGLAREVQVDRSLTREVDVARGLARGLDPGPVRLCSLGGPGGRSQPGVRRRGRTEELAAVLTCQNVATTRWLVVTDVGGRLDLRTWPNEKLQTDSDERF